MPFSLMTRVLAVAAVASVAGGYASGYGVAELKGDYKVELNVQETTYIGTVKAIASAKGAFTAKLEFTSPTVILADATGKTAGDSVTYDAKYEDKSRGCTGTIAAKGTIEKDGNKASGTIDVNDSCGGALAGTFRMWR